MTPNSLKQSLSACVDLLERYPIGDRGEERFHLANGHPSCSICATLTEARAILKRWKDNDDNELMALRRMRDNLTQYARRLGVSEGDFGSISREWVTEYLWRILQASGAPYSERYSYQCGAVLVATGTQCLLSGNHDGMHQFHANPCCCEPLIVNANCPEHRHLLPPPLLPIVDGARPQA